MLAAALVPEIALLVPGASGATEVLDELREVVLAAVADLVATGPDRVVVVAPRHPGHPSSQEHVSRLGDPGRGPDAGSGRDVALGRDGVVHLAGPLHPTLAAAGVDDAYLGWTVPVAPGSVPVQDVAPAVGLHLLAGAGWVGVTEVVVVPADARIARRCGAGLAGAGVDGPVLVGADGPASLGADGRVLAGDQTALLLLGSLSARRGPDGPLPDDARAPEADSRVLADLTALGGRDGSEARRRLMDLPAAWAAELAISAWAPWQVLCGAMGEDSRWESAPRWSGAPFGATYAVLTWEPR